MDSYIIHKDDMLYAHFGAAALAAQLLEQNVALALFARFNREKLLRRLARKIVRP